MGAHPVGVRLDERRPVARAGPVQRLRGHRVHGEHVVAVDPDAGQAEAGRAAVERCARLALDRLGDGPLVVLAEEDDRRVVRGREDQALVDVALAGGPVAEEAHDRGVALGVAAADEPVALQAHAVAGRLQALRADDDRVEVDAVRGDVPGARVGAAEHRQQAEGVDPAADGDAVLAVGGEGVVLAPHRVHRTDLGALLAEQRGPQTQLALALQRDRLGVDAADADHVGVELPDQRVVTGEGVRRVLDPLAVRRQQLDRRVGTAVVARRSDRRSPRSSRTPGRVAPGDSGQRTPGAPGRGKTTCGAYFLARPGLPAGVPSPEDGRGGPMSAGRHAGRRTRRRGRERDGRAHGRTGDAGRADEDGRGDEVAYDRLARDRRWSSWRGRVRCAATRGITQTAELLAAQGVHGRRARPAGSGRERRRGSARPRPGGRGAAGGGRGDRRQPRCSADTRRGARSACTRPP